MGTGRATAHFDFHGCTALITGATSNLGLATAQAFARAGASVGILGGSDHDALDKAVHQMRAMGVAAAGSLANLSNEDAALAAVTVIEDQLGPVDILVNNAATRSQRSVEELSVVEWDRTFAVNLRAPFVLAQHVLPSMLNRGFGRIVNIAGLNIWWASESSVHVSAAKAGLLGLTASMAMRGARHGVTVNTVIPGFIDTPSQQRAGDSAREQTVSRLVPMGRPARMEEVVDTVLFLASSSASYITGQTVTVSGGAHPMVALD
jgi:3-oxoacyl-[acyl-carrier protein] reductase